MTPNDLYEKLWQLSLTAGMNQRYYESQEHSLWVWDTTFQLVALFFGALTLVVSMVPTPKAVRKSKSDEPEPEPRKPTRFSRSVDWTVSNLSPIFAFLTIAGMGLGSIVNVSDWHRKATELRTYWTQIRADAESVSNSLAINRDKPAAPDWLIDRYNDLQSRRVTIMSSEPSVNRTLLERCWNEEIESRKGLGPQQKTATRDVNLLK